MFMEELWVGLLACGTGWKQRHYQQNHESGLKAFDCLSFRILEPHILLDESRIQIKGESLFLPKQAFRSLSRMGAIDQCLQPFFFKWEDFCLFFGS
jgi:hypothetical protein